MAKKVKLGIPLFFNNASNSGIVNYIFNIISALNTLDKEKKPKIILLYLKDTPVDMIKNISYPFIEFRCLDKKQNLADKFIGKVSNKLKLGKIVARDNYRGIDLLYPYIEFHDGSLNEIKHKIHWLVDFNNKFFPGHYADGGKFMDDFQQKLVSRKEHVVLSSNALFDELKKFYPDYKCNVSILKFACSLPNLSGVHFDNLKEKFHLKKAFIMSPNQFWEHKNQLVLIEALNHIKQDGLLSFDLVFTGSMNVNRGKGHMLEKIMILVKEYGLEQNVKFLGIIERDEQLVLMKNCVGLIQPSLYEGWSTLVEEAKALNQNIVLSNLSVHKEQNCVNSIFFDPHDAKDLAEKILLLFNNKQKKIEVDYNENIQQYGRDLRLIFEKELYN